MLEAFARACELSWTLVPLETPAVIRHCPGCEARARFRSRGAFRINANKRRLDVWLLYGCETCDDTWKLTVAERALPDVLGERLRRYEANDAALAETVAFDHGLLEGRGHRVDRAVPFRVDGGGSPLPSARVRLTLAAPLRARLDATLAAGLGISRSQLRRAVLIGPGRQRWGRTVTNGEVVTIDTAGRRA